MAAGRHGLPFLVRAWQGELQIFGVIFFQHSLTVIRIIECYARIGERLCIFGLLTVKNNLYILKTTSVAQMGQQTASISASSVTKVLRSSYRRVPTCQI